MIIKKENTKKALIIILIILISMLVGIILTKTLQKNNCLPLKDGSSNIKSGEWTILYILNNSQFNTEGDIEGRIVYPNYMVLNLKEQTIMEVIETFHHEMAHLYVFVDEKHFLGNNDSEWSEYNNKIGVNNAPKFK